MTFVFLLWVASLGVVFTSSPIYLNISKFQFALQLNKIPFCIGTTFSLSIHPWLFPCLKYCTESSHELGWAHMIGDQVLWVHARLCSWVVWQIRSWQSLCLCVWAHWRRALAVLMQNADPDGSRGQSLTLSPTAHNRIIDFETLISRGERN